MRTTRRWAPSAGAFVVNEPMGAMGWFPNNNHPRDKATYDFHLTVPIADRTRDRQRRAGRRKVDNGNGTKTWNWKLGYPMASYLSTSTIGLFDYAPVRRRDRDGRERRSR